MKERNHLEDLGVDGSINIMIDLKRNSVRLWIGFIWLMKGSGCGLL
jgi:hypothetical protein